MRANPNWATKCFMPSAPEKCVTVNAFVEVLKLETICCVTTTLRPVYDHDYFDILMINVKLVITVLTSHKC
jgi:hypothetical protein